MIKRITTIAWSVVFVALFVELLIGARTTFDVLHPRPATPTPTEATPTRALPTGTPVGWRQYTSVRLGITLYYPDTWSPAPADSLNQTALPDHFIGPDGFFQLETLQNNTVIDKLCDLQAHGHSEFFGVTPHTTREQVANMPTCLIEPGNDNPPQRRSQALFQSPWADPSYTYITLSADPEHFARIVKSVGIGPTPPLSTTPTPAPAATALPTEQLPTPVFSANRFTSGLTSEEYTVVSALVDTPNHAEFTQRIPASVLANRAPQRAPSMSTRLVFADRLLSPLNWHFDTDVSGQAFNIFQNNQLVKTGMQNFSPIQVNAAGTDFKTVVTDGSGAAWLVQSNGMAPWDGTLHFNVPPVFAGNDVVSVDTVADKPSQLSVTRAGAVAFTLTLDQTAPGDPAVILGSYNGSWYLDLNGMLFQNGQLQNRKLGLDEIFNWQLLNGQPLYFFTQYGTAGISYNGTALPVSYASVVHSTTGAAAAFNPQGNETMVWFYASEKGQWVYVELGAFPNP